jgi:hypothetical protein
VFERGEGFDLALVVIVFWFFRHNEIVERRLTET